MEYIYMRIKIRQKKRLVPPIFILAEYGRKRPNTAAKFRGDAISDPKYSV